MKISSPMLPAHIAHKLAAAIAHCSNLSIFGILSTGKEDELVFFLGDGTLTNQSGIQWIAQYSPWTALVFTATGLHTCRIKYFTPVVFPKLFVVCLRKIFDNGFSNYWHSFYLPPCDNIYGRHIWWNSCVIEWIYDRLIQVWLWFKEDMYLR